MSLLHKYFFAVLTLLIVSRCNICSGQRFSFFNLKVENGLVQSQATCLTQDSFGNLWIGTLGGVSRYDGKKIRNYTVSDGLNSNTIIDILYTGPGRIFISTGKGLQLFDGTTFREIRDEQGKNAIGISQITAGQNTCIYFLKRNRLCYYDSIRRQVTSSALQEELTTLYCDGDQLLAAARNGIIYMLAAGSLQKKDSVVSGDAGLFVIRLFRDSRKTLWALCNKGLYRVTDRGYLPFTIGGKEALPIPLISVAEDRNGQLWFASSVGLFRMKDTTIIRFHQKNGLTDNVIYETICDREGNIWLSTDGEGVFRYSGGPFISLDESFGLPNKQVTGITGDPSGTVYFASYRGKLCSYNLQGAIRTIDAPELNNDVINSIVWQEPYGLWIATRNNGLFLLQRNRLQRSVMPREMPPNQQVTTLYKLSNGTVLAGVGSGIAVLSGAHRQFIPLSGAKSQSFAEISPDSVLIATDSGFSLLHHGTISRWHTRTIIDSTMAQCMVYSSGKLFVGTAERGIIVYTPATGNYSVLNTRKGLSSDFVYNMVRDTAGNIWAGTGMGICRITPDQQGNFRIKLFGKDNGIIGLESNSNAAFIDPYGHIWFGTTEGVSCYFPSARPTKAAPARIVLESVKLFGGKSIDSTFFTRRSGWYSVPEGLNLPYRFNNLNFSFQAITLSPVDKILYRYILEGSGSNWSEWSEESTINFSALEPGRYTLKVMCMIGGVVQEQAMLSYSFSIQTPFHKSIWFLLSILGASLLLGVYLQYAASRRKVRRQQREDALRREEQSRVRERTAEDFHDEVGNKLTRINVLTNVLKSKLGASNPDAERLIQQIQDNSHQLYTGTRDILWSLQPSNDNLYEILNHIRDLATELFSDTSISFSLSGNEESYKEFHMPLDKSRNFIMIWKEALNNCMKYARASRVMLQVQRLDNEVQVRLVDDGQGFDLTTVPLGNGVKNMRSRAQRMDAGLEILSSDKGTQVILSMPEGK